MPGTDTLDGHGSSPRTAEVDTAVDCDAPNLLLSPLDDPPLVTGQRGFSGLLADLAVATDDLSS